MIEKVKKKPGRKLHIALGQPMDGDKYDLLRKLMRIGESPSSNAARLVLVDGESVKKAAEAMGIKDRAVFYAVHRMKEGYAIAKAVAE